MSDYNCKTHGYFRSTLIKGDVPCPWCELDARASEGKIYRVALEAIVRPDSGMKNGGITCRAIANLALIAVSDRQP